MGISFENRISNYLKTALGMGAVSFCDTLYFWRSQAKISLAKDLADSPVRRVGNAQITYIRKYLIFWH